MVNSKQTEKTSQRSEGSLAKPLAPEEIRVGEYVSLLHVFYDLPSFLWCGDSALQRRDETVRICYLPETGGVPFKVKSICLPFVLVKKSDRTQQTLDVRKVRLARLDRAYAKAAWRANKKKAAEAPKRL
jgi:hypothetical protein